MRDEEEVVLPLPHGFTLVFSHWWWVGTEESA